MTSRLGTENRLPFLHCMLWLIMIKQFFETVLCYMEGAWRFPQKVQNSLFEVYRLFLKISRLHTPL